MSCKSDVNVYMKYAEISKLKAHDLGLSSVDILVGKSSSIFLSLSLSLQAFALVERKKECCFFQQNHGFLSNVVILHWNNHLKKW